MSAVDHVTVNAGDIEGHLSMLSHPEHSWVIYLVSLLHSVTIIIFGKHAFESGYGHLSYAMPDLVGVDIILFHWMPVVQTQACLHALPWV